MNITQLSANIDAKLVQLEQQLEQLEQQVLQNNGDNPELQNTIETLKQLKLKLMKSRDLAWRAHQLQSKNEPTSSSQYRIIGLVLCVFSGLGLAAIAVSVILR
jgi:TolA-binding protein